MSAVSVYRYPEHQVVLVKTAQKPTIYRDLNQKKLDCSDQGPARLINCIVEELIANSSVEIYGSIVKRAKVLGDILLSNSDITNVACYQTVVDFGGSRMKQINTSNVIHLKSSPSRKIAPFYVENGANVYLAKGSFKNPMILSSL